MVGILILICFFIGYIIHCFRDGADNSDSRNEAAIQNRPYYMDLDGNWRHEHYNVTEEELEEYARKIGAIL